MTLSAKALCVLGGAGEGLKDELGITGTSEDVRLERLIESASAAIARFCGIPSFHHESARVEDHPGFGTPILHVDKRPLLSITSIVYDPQDAASTVLASEYLIDNAAQGRIYRAGGWRWTAATGISIAEHRLPGTEESLYRVTFAGGYRTRNQVKATLDGALTGAAVVAVVVNETIPTDTPDTGTIRILLDAGTYREIDYTSWTAKTFTIASTSFVSPNDAADGNTVEITENLTLPSDLEDAATMLAALRYKWSPRDPTIASERLLSWSAKYRETGGMPPDVEGLLSPHVRPVWA